MRRLICLVRGHRWRVTENRETQGSELDCERCGTHRSTYPGDPSFRPSTRPSYGGQAGVDDGTEGF